MSHNSPIQCYGLWQERLEGCLAEKDPEVLAVGHLNTSQQCEHVACIRNSEANRTREGLGQTLGKISSLKGLSNIGTGCPRKWFNHHPWWYLKDVQMWCLEASFISRLGSVRLRDSLS